MYIGLLMLLIDHKRVVVTYTPPLFNLSIYSICSTKPLVYVCIVVLYTLVEVYVQNINIMYQLPLIRIAIMLYVREMITAFYEKCVFSETLFNLT